MLAKNGILPRAAQVIHKWHICTVQECVDKRLIFNV